VHIGRYGGYVKAGEETRSLKTQDDAFTVDVAAASALLDTPKKPRFTRKKGAKSAYRKRRTK
jgi:topoisomerase IA-like protein